MTNLSVLISHHEKHELLEKTLHSLLPQISKTDEILIIDDSSPSGPPQEQPNVKVIEMSPRKKTGWRLNSVRNFGLMRARNDCVLLMDSDCIPEYTLVENAKKLFEVVTIHGGSINYIQEDDSIKKDKRGTTPLNDNHNRSPGGLIYGGVMLFSKARTRLFGWFDTSFDGGWGGGENDFANKAHNSGMCLRYSPELSVTHQYHKRVHPNSDRNIAMWKRNIEQNNQRLNLFTPYKPAIGVNILTFNRPKIIEPCLKSVFKTILPLKVRLVNQGDQSTKQREALKPWINRWAVDYFFNKGSIEPAIQKNAGMKYFANKKFRYMILLDDDMFPMKQAIYHLVKVAYENPDYKAISGYMVNPKVRSLGGPIKDGQHYYYKTQHDLIETDYISGGFCIVKLDKPVYFNDSWKVGWNDWLWSNLMKEKGYKIGVTGRAVAMHRHETVNGELQRMNDPVTYTKVRYNRESFEEMAQLYESMCGFRPKVAIRWEESKYYT